MSRRLTTLAAVGVSAALLSACGTGLEAQTYKESGRTDSGRADLGGISVRNLYVAPPATGSTIATTDTATVSGVVTNSGDTADSLTAASSPVASSVTLAEATGPVTSIPVPAHGRTSTSWTLVLSGLSQELHAGQYVSITLDFSNAGRTTIQVPVRAGDQDLDGRTVEQNPYGEAK